MLFRVSHALVSFITIWGEEVDVVCFGAHEREAACHRGESRFLSLTYGTRPYMLFEMDGFCYPPKQNIYWGL